MSALDGEYWSGLAQDRYEARLMDEARAIVAGELDQVPTVEHLRVALAWLDGRGYRGDESQPF